MLLLPLFVRLRSPALSLTLHLSVAHFHWVTHHPQYFLSQHLRHSMESRFDPGGSARPRRTPTRVRPFYFVLWFGNVQMSTSSITASGGEEELRWPLVNQSSKSCSEQSPTEKLGGVCNLRGEELRGLGRNPRGGWLLFSSTCSGAFSPLYIFCA